jgi:hypothetical protein
MEMEKERRPGSRWRVLARDGERQISAQNEGIFDELVVDDWLHLEQMDDTRWWMRLADVRIESRFSLMAGLRFRSSVVCTIGRNAA